MSNISISKQRVSELIAGRKMSPESVLLDYDVQNDEVKFKDFAQLSSLADKLVVPIKDFFEEDDLDHGVKIGRKSNAFSRTIEKNGTKYYTYNHLATTKTEPNLMSLRVELHCKDQDKVTLNSGHVSKEIVYVTKGKVRMDWKAKDGNQHYEELNVGDSAYVSPYIPHSFMALEDSSELIAVNY